MTLLSGVRDRLRAAHGRRSAGHPHDGRLLALLDGPGAAGDRAHLADCPSCAARLAELRAFLDGLRREAEAACDEALSPARLTTGRQRIRSRVRRAAGRDGPRVLRFPGAARRQPGTPRRSRWWMGAAAAAGLVIGLTVGRFDARLDLGTADAPAGIAPAGTAADRSADPGSHAGDELFMQELERALTSPPIPALAALDELTPRLHEVAVDVR
ncbi:MAG: hypothetical protein OXF93_22390 [Acidobacteria bacterium]|nr:hypothetical protein [Acidobacteriota bacterium]